MRHTKLFTYPTNDDEFGISVGPFKPGSVLLKITSLCTVRLENGTLEILCRISNHRMLLECILSTALK